MTKKAWSLIAIAGDRIYAGNRGYEENPREVYRYDSDVANHAQISAGDLVFIRNRRQLLGVATIEGIDEAAIEKIRQRCPECSTPNLRFRKTLAPTYRCVHGHEFEVPLAERVTVRGFSAFYARTFLDTPDGIPLETLKAAAYRPNDQLSIEQVDPSELELSLTEAFPSTKDLLAKFLQSMDLTAGDPFSHSVGSEEEQFRGSMTDQRKKVLRSISTRRGQNKFREALLRRYSRTCVVSGCQLEDILEAAHIWPYRSQEDHHPANGLLLRADLHTLFDLNLMAIEPESLQVRFHPAARAEGYAGFDCRYLQINPKARPAEIPLKMRWAVFSEIIERGS